jgi:hypothetical protein
MSKQSDSSKRKRVEEDTVPPDLNEPQKMRGIKTNYRYLNDPFSDEEKEEEQIQLTSAERIFVMFTETQLGGDEPRTLEEAKWSPKWPEWEHAVQTELAQLREMGTWKLVNKPADAVPISNKWVFLKKFNKLGDLLKYKGRLVVKGCTQRPGHDYLETFSPVIRLETIRGILALATSKDLKIQQMDVKEAYLNGTLKEKVYTSAKHFFSFCYFTELFCPFTTCKHLGSKLSFRTMNSQVITSQKSYQRNNSRKQVLVSDTKVQ